MSITAQPTGSEGGIQSVAPALRRLAMEVSGQSSLVILAVDGVSHAVAATTWRPTRLQALRTTFPSTSTTAWLTAFTGVRPSVHLVPGMAFAVGDKVVRAVAPGPDELVGDTPTVFEQLSFQSLTTVACPGLLSWYDGPWSRALLRGARRWPSRREGHRASDPRAVVQASIADVEDALTGRPTVVWAYVDIDSTVHLEGYSGRVREALEQLDDAARRWSARGFTTVALSDHGAVAVEHRDELRSAWNELERSDLCRLPGGGAGRTRWLYAAPGRARELVREASAAFGDVACVLSRAELAHRGLLDTGGPLESRVGEVVAVATHPAFPVPDLNYEFDHGALTDEEVMVPLALWSA